MKQHQPAHLHIKTAIHGAFYHWAKAFVHGKYVLDAGCGRGDGTTILAQTAGRVIGVDNAPDVISGAHNGNGSSNAEYYIMDAGSLSFKSDSFDMVVSNALLEYLTDYEVFLAEVFRVLKPDGLFICGTKNLTLSLKQSDSTPLYKNHYQEFTPAQLRAAVSDYFLDIEMYSQLLRPNARAHLLDARALKIEWLLVKFGIKHRFPLRWRAFMRKLITGIDVASVTLSDFEFVAGCHDDAWYIIGCGRKP